MKGRDNKGRFAKGNKFGNRFGTTDERREMAKKAGVQSGKSRRAFRTIYDAAIEMGEEEIMDKSGTPRKLVDFAVRKQYELAAKGDTAAFMAIMKARKEDVQKVEVEERTPLVIDYTEQPE